MELSIENLKQILSKSSSMGSTVMNFKDDESIVQQGVDSLDMLDYYLNLEEAFDVKIPDSDVDQLKTFQDILRYLKEKLK